MSVRIQRHKKTVQLMIKLYCRNNHGTYEELCHDCNDLADYAREKLSNCPFDKEKPVCSKCTIHCYRKDYREKIKKVMRYSGKRILISNPRLSILYLIEKLIYTNNSIKNENINVAKRAKSTF